MIIYFGINVVESYKSGIKLGRSTTIEKIVIPDSVTIIDISRKIDRY